MKYLSEKQIPSIFQKFRKQITVRKVKETLTTCKSKIKFAVMN
jgi:hypothetical protein